MGILAEGRNKRLLRWVALVALGMLISASCTSEPAEVGTDATSSSTPATSDGSPTTQSAGPGVLLVELIGEVTGSLICPGYTQPCVTLDREVGTGPQRVLVRFTAGEAQVETSEPVASPLANFVDRCEGVLPEAEFEKVAALSQEEQEAAEADGTYAYDLLGRYILTIPDSYAVRWLSGTRRVHLGVVGDAAPHVEALDAIGLGDVVCVAGGFAHSDATLDNVQLEVSDMLKGWAHVDDWGHSRDAFVGAVVVGMYEVDAEMIAESRERFGDLVVLEGSFIVLNGSLEELHAQLALANDDDRKPQLRANCGDVVFPSMPPDVNGFPVLDAEAQSIFDEFISGPLSVESGYLADFDMSIAERSEGSLVLFGQSPDGGSFVDVTFERRDDVWSASRWGGCSVLVSAPGFGSALTVLDPEIEPDPTSTTLHISIQERACASGQAPTDREVVPVVVETATTVEITTLVEPVSGNADCPGNPWFAVTVVLDQPLGSRTVIDMQSPPGIERTWPPSLNDL